MATSETSPPEASIKQSYHIACDLFKQRQYGECRKLLKICIQLLSQSTIELLPECLDMLAECCTQLGDVNQACVFKKFETMYYEQVLVRKSLDMIDEEKENYQEIIDRVAKLEKLARLCDQNDCASLAVEYMTRATQIRSNCLADSNRDSRVRQDEIQQFLAKKARQDYERNVSQVHTQQQEQKETPNTQVRKRTSILKQQSINGQSSKKKVHWPETLPRYTVEKRWRNIRRFIFLIGWCILIDFLSRHMIPLWMSAYQTQIKTVTILMTVVLVLLFQ